MKLKWLLLLLFHPLSTFVLHSYFKFLSFYPAPGRCVFKVFFSFFDSISHIFSSSLISFSFYFFFLIFFHHAAIPCSRPKKPLYCSHCTHFRYLIRWSIRDCSFSGWFCCSRRNCVNSCRVT